MSCQLYLITPADFVIADFIPQLKSVLDAAPIACLQLRLKDKSDDEICRAAEAVLPLTHAHNIPLLINDRPELAHKIGADGCHIGQEDMPYAEARQLLGDAKVIGVTCHNSRHLAMQAGEAGADYVAFGAFYPSATKQAKTQAQPELIAWWSELFTTPCVAIGGIEVENAPPLIEAGADFLAVSAGIWQYEDGAAIAAQNFNRLF